MVPSPYLQCAFFPQPKGRNIHLTPHFEAVVKENMAPAFKSSVLFGKKDSLIVNPHNHCDASKKLIRPRLELETFSGLTVLD